MTKLPAGLVDAGASSLATFAAGVAATRILNPSDLGIYAIFFSAWLLASQIPSQAVLVPVEAELAQLPADRRARYLLHNTILAMPAALLAAATVLGVMLFVPGGGDRETSFQLGLTAAAVAALFPMQDHARRLLHLSRSHWAAAQVSLVRLVVTGIVLAVGWNAGLDPGLLPFGSLAAGDILALTVSFVIIRPQRRLANVYSFRSLIRSGKWLLLSASMGPAAGFAVALLVTGFADAAALGLAEAARVAAQPILVLAVGLAAVLRPASMEAAIAGDQLGARRLSRRLGVGLALASLVYVAMASLPASVNPLQALIPTAFTASGLVQISVVAALFNGIVFLQRAELIALNKTASLSAAEASSSLGRIAVGTASFVVRSWAVPLGFLVGGLIRWFSLSRYLRFSYEASPLVEE